MGPALSSGTTQLLLRDHIALLARLRVIGHDRQAHLQTLPRERAALFLDSIKQTGDISDGFWFHLGLTQAREFILRIWAGRPSNSTP